MRQLLPLMLNLFYKKSSWETDNRQTKKMISTAEAAPLETVTDFLIKLGMKPRMHLWEISIFPLCHVIVRPTKIMNRADKNRAHF